MTFNMNGQTTITADYAENNVIYRLTITELSPNSYQLELNPLVKNDLNLINSSITLTKLNEEVFKAAIFNMIMESTKPEYNDNIQMVIKSCFKSFEAYKIIEDNETNNKYLEKYFLDKKNISDGLINAIINEDSISEDSIIIVTKILEKEKENLANLEILMLKNNLNKKIISSFIDLNKELNLKNGIFGDEPFYGLTESDMMNRNDLLTKLKNLQDSSVVNQTIVNIIEYLKRDTNDYFKILNFKIFNLKEAYNVLSSFLYVDTSKLDVYTKNNFSEKFIKKNLRALDKKRQFNVSLIGDANFVASFNNSSTTQAMAGFGLMASKPEYEEFYGIITVAESIDEITSNWGQTVLIPGVSRFSLMTKWRMISIFPYSKCNFLTTIGLGLDINVSPYKWVKDIITQDSTQTTIQANAVPASANLILPITFAKANKSGQNFSISTDMGFTFRYIGGDISKDNLNNFLGNTNRFYFGLIGGVDIRYNALRAQFHMPLIFSKNNVDGLTNGQVYASIGILSNLSNDISKIVKPKQN
jgi:hypothetical protein